MNWVGGARSRVYKADFKSKKGQRKLQKEYFEKRRLGAINLIAPAKNAVRSNHPKETKYKISQDILEFQNLKQHVDGVANPIRARSAFRVVNLNKKTVTQKCANPKSLNYEEVEIPLSPVDKYSTSNLNLSQSPSSQEENMGASSAIQPRKQHTFHRQFSTSTSNKSDAAHVNEKHQSSKCYDPINLQSVVKRSSDTLSYDYVLSKKSKASSTIDLFGTTIEKPEKCRKSAAMPPPSSSFGVSSTKAKRKKPYIAPRVEERWSSKFSSGSDYPSDNILSSHFSSTSNSNIRNRHQYEISPILDYPSVGSNNRITQTAAFQIVPSQSNCSIKVVYRGNEDAYTSNQSDSFKLLSPLRPSDLIITEDKETVVNQLTSSNSSSIFEESRLNYYANSPSTGKCYSPVFSIPSVICDGYDTHPHSRINKKLCKNRGATYDDGLFLPTPMKSSENQNWHIDYFQSHENSTNGRNCITTPNVIDAFNFDQSLKPESIKLCKSFGFSDEWSSSCNIFSNISSTYHLEKIEKSAMDGNILINKRLTAQWCNMTREQESQSQREKNPTPEMDEDVQVKQPPSFLDDKRRNLFDPLQASTPCNAPICLNKQAMTMDLDKHRTMPIDEDKVYPVTDLLDEMIELETQTQEKEIRSENEKPMSKDFRSTQTEENVKSDVKMLVSSLVSRVEEDSNKTKKVNGIISQPITSQAKCVTPESASIDGSLTSGVGYEIVPKDMCQGYEENDTIRNDGAYHCQKHFSENIPVSVESTASIKIHNNLALNSTCHLYIKGDLLDHDNEKANVPLTEDSEKNKTFGGIRSLKNSLNYNPSQSNSSSEMSLFSVDKSLKAAQHHNIDLNSAWPMSLHESNQNCNTSGGKLIPKTAPTYSTVSTQTNQKKFKDTASSPINIFTSKHDHVKDCNPEKSKNAIASKVYSLRPRSRLCDLSKQEE